MLSSAAMAFICAVFFFRFCWYTASCSATSGPGCRAMTALSSVYNFSFSCITSPFSTTSSVLLISLRCSVWIFWINSKVAGSEPSSLRHLCTFMGFSSSSDRAVTLVFSCRSSLCSCSTSLFISSTWGPEPLLSAISRTMSCSLIRSSRMSSMRSPYCTSPFFKALCCMRSFSYSRASSSLRRISCVPSMSLSLITLSYSFLCARASSSILRRVEVRFLSSFSCCRTSSWLPERESLVRSSLVLVTSMSFSARWYSKCSFTMAWSFEAISSFNCSI
mmetsp:Transcript_34002/g.74901  ORF Transcript_34002/g.74901 Transcript_34002/m.74901 type:complete len:276 (-) Transcript_34002:1784-2611(-)